MPCFLALVPGLRALLCAWAGCFLPGHFLPAGVLIFLGVRLVCCFLTESLILAQDERWRRA